MPRRSAAGGLLDGRRHLRTEIDAIIAKARSHETDGGASLTAIGKVVDDWGEEVDTALLRARYTLGQILYRQGAVREALDAHLTTVAIAERAGFQGSPYATNARALAVLCAYEIGDWDRAAELAAHGAELSEEAAAPLDAAASLLHAGRGGRRAIKIFRCLRSQWEFDRSTVVQSGVAALDAHGWSGDLDGARALRRDVVTYLRRIEEQAQVMVEVRLDALLLGHLATRAHLAGADERAALLEEGEELLGEALSVWDSEPGLPPKTTEARAWESRARAEHAHLRWRAGESVDLNSLVGEFSTCAGLFASRGDRYEESRCRSRLASVLTAAGRGDEADRERDAAIETARALGAAPLAAELGSAVAGVAGGSTAGSPVPSPSHPETPRRVVVQLTPREHEVLTLVARGRSNGEVGRELFISTKTVSVHVSNILAKLGASGRGEAVALARDLGLLE
ncbi:helix-turn-helix transcriptional regulator [Mobilicoccus caccae]|uniref:HTH luxR-type domain-containing protein n=1 Tax=Mobilicoccus caccae TaxID=1859295 RepID=A0ABQ6IS52_9MICO|nr:response regulator transcription factor [Mobilicoccus caccae]GMA40763.1 hypothetical protein GCM10025883_28080 [Mobilicoccus caccae]